MFKIIIKKQKSQLYQREKTFKYFVIIRNNFCTGKIDNQLKKDRLRYSNTNLKNLISKIKKIKKKKKSTIIVIYQKLCINRCQIYIYI